MEDCRYEYGVLDGKILKKAKLLEDELNELSSNGWRVVCSILNMLILERKIILKSKKRIVIEQQPIQEKKQVNVRKEMIKQNALKSYMEGRQQQRQVQRPQQTFYPTQPQEIEPEFKSPDEDELQEMYPDEEVFQQYEQEEDGQQ